MGLAKATEIVAVGGRQDRARARFDEGWTVAHRADVAAETAD
jgi:hypothetical protein